MASPAQAQLIFEYNTAELQLAPLQSSEGTLQALDQQLGAKSQNIARLNGSISQLQQDEARLGRRIHRNENPRFLHYLVCNRESKVQRLKEELEQKTRAEEIQTATVATETTEVNALQQQRAQAQGAVAVKQQLEARCKAIFDQVVDMQQPPPPALQQLNAGLQQQTMQWNAEQALLQAVGACVQRADQGRAEFSRAQQLYQEARALNEQAKLVTREEAWEERREVRDEVVGDNFGAERAERSREMLEQRERQLQSQRDALVNQAQAEAMRGYQSISSAFASFPAQARARYPAICVSIGSVAFPRVSGANFSSALLADAIFGTTGAAMNDFASGCTIQDNMNIMAQCLSITDQQLQQVHAVQQAVNATSQQLQAGMQDLQRRVLAERQNIFNAARASVAATAA